ncbi:MAG: AI-2E family transporter [Caldimonas sp.]
MNDAPAASPRTHSTWVARALLAVAVVFLLENAKPLMLPIVIAVAFTFVLAAPVRWLRRRGMPDYLGAGLVIGAVLSVVALLVSLLAAPAADWWARAPGTVHRLIESAQQLRVAAFPEALSGAPRRPVTSTAPGTPTASTMPAAPAASAPGGAVVDPLTEQLTTEGISITRAALGQMLSFTVAASATVFLLYFLLASEHWLIARTVEAIPRRRSRALLLSGIRQAQVEIGLFITTMGLISIGLGIATGLALAAIGFPNPVLWGTTTAVLTFVPYIGPVLVTLALLVAGGMESGTGLAMLVPPALFLGLHFIESNFISPLIMGARLRINPVFVFLSVLFWSWLWGIAGAFVAVPLLLGLRAVSQRSRRLRIVRIYLDADAAQADAPRGMRAPTVETGASTSDPPRHR